MPIKNIEKRKEYQKKYNKKHYVTYKNKRLLLTYKRRQDTKEFIDTLKKDGCCICGESAIECLDFHHLDPLIKEISISKTITQGWSNKRILEEIKKCIIVCSNCHRKIEAGTLSL